jgi:hypothetical protein
MPKNDKFPSDCVCCKATHNHPIINNKHITIIGGNLDFVYNTEDKVSFWSNGSEISEGFVATEGNDNLSFRLDIDDEVPEKASILAKVKEEGNLIFIHPDN